MTTETDDERWRQGLAMAAAIYGPGSPVLPAQPADTPLIGETIRHLFGEIWARPGLSMRDKRLLVIGATTMLGRADALEIQIAGAVVNQELSEAELDEIALLMLYYGGAANSIALHRGIEGGKKLARTMQAG